MKISETCAFVNQFVVGLLVMIGFGGTVGLGTVWMRHQVSVLADQNSQLETQLKDVERHIASTSALVEAARSQDVLAAKNESMHLGLEEMTLGQVFAVREDPIRALVARANQRVFQSEGHALTSSLDIHLDLAPPVAPALAAATARGGASTLTPPAKTAANVAPGGRPKSPFAFTD